MQGNKSPENHYKMVKHFHELPKKKPKPQPHNFSSLLSEDEHNVLVRTKYHKCDIFNYKSFLTKPSNECSERSQGLLPIIISGP